jgi:hypothetical protein
LRFLSDSFLPSAAAALLAVFSAATLSFCGFCSLTRSRDVQHGQSRRGACLAAAAAAAAANSPLSFRFVQLNCGAYPAEFSPLCKARFCPLLLSLYNHSSSSSFYCVRQATAAAAAAAACLHVVRLRRCQSGLLMALCLSSEVQSVASGRAVGRAGGQDMPSLALFSPSPI